MKTKKKKLSLKKLTIANLHNEELKKIYGGMPTGEICCSDNCYTGGHECVSCVTIDYTCVDP